MSRRFRHRQRGVAVVTALLLTTLAITIVASLFWQQQVQVRSIENQRLQLQKQWILRGALDWTRLILREDKRITSLVDHLGEPWAVPLAETRLDQYVENARADSDVPDAVLSGSIFDAQARFNLNNLYQGGNINPDEVKVFERLLTYLQLNPALAQATAKLVESAQKKPASSSDGPPSSIAASEPQPMGITHVDDLLAVPGFTPEILAKIRDFVIVLPFTGTTTMINANTAPAEVLAARIDTLSLADANVLVAKRQSAWFRNFGEIQSAMDGKNFGTGEGKVSVNSDYFLVNGNVRLNRAGMTMQALVDRTQSNPRVIWVREN
jgi:general secretion pathway protein K